jgi:MerR family transcriptional regulator, thiopeptide resistance regulator
MANDAVQPDPSPDRQQGYEAWLTARGLGPALAHAKAGQVEAGPGDWALVEAPLVALFRAGRTPEDAELHDALEDHRALVALFWRRDCSGTAYAGLAEIYGHPDFVARYEALAKGFSTWLPAAMRGHAVRLAASGG